MLQHTQRPAMGGECWKRELTGFCVAVFAGRGHYNNAEGLSHGHGVHCKLVLHRHFVPLTTSSQHTQTHPHPRPTPTKTNPKSKPRLDCFHPFGPIVVSSTLLGTSASQFPRNDHEQNGGGGLVVQRGGAGTCQWPRRLFRQLQILFSCLPLVGQQDTQDLLAVITATT
ncbi:hypothetical protein LIA77_02895 [Sarocladium implicatum]|nr:hypothetical protein LIA77_02895 [Sarocladium implicatum]